MAGLDKAAVGLVSPCTEWCTQAAPGAALLRVPRARARAVPLSLSPLGTPSPLRRRTVTGALAAPCAPPSGAAVARQRRAGVLRASSPTGTEYTPRRTAGVRRSAAEPGVQQKTEAEAAEGTDAAGESSDDISKEVAKAVKKTASTFAPRASGKSRNPAVPGSTLYRIFEVQAYASMAVGGLLSFNLLFPSDQPDVWRLMGMWSVWMFTIPSLRARDCSEREKTALNYLFLVVPLINVSLPLVWKSFAAVWTSDVIAFFAFYAWKMEWLKQSDSISNE